MIQEIQYNGLAANPSDYECHDGQLAMALGLVPEDGALKPVLPPKILFTLEDGQKVVFIHKNGIYKHYIAHDEKTNAVLYRKDPRGFRLLRKFESDIHSYNSVGNTLIVIASDGIHYFLWKGAKTDEETDYVYLGTHIPEISLIFSLNTSSRRSHINDVTGLSWHRRPEGYYLVSEDCVNALTDAVLGQVNRLINEEVAGNGCFMFPFFVRYAYRLYDGSLTMHSAPILMMPSTDDALLCLCTNADDTGADFDFYGISDYLYYTLWNPQVLEQLRNWKDIVRSVDIFVSPQFYTYDQNGKCERLYEDVVCNGYSVSSRGVAHDGEGGVYPGAPPLNVYRSVKCQTKEIFGFNEATTHLTVQLPKKDQDKVLDEIKSNHLFYLVKSINVETLNAEGATVQVQIGKDVLGSLATREAMTDDYDSHDIMLAEYSLSYNNRLNLAGISKMLFEGYNPASMFTACDGSLSPGHELSMWACTVYFFIKQDGKEIVVSETAARFGYDAPFVYLYYPGINAYKAVLEHRGKRYSVKLMQHETLNGAYYFGGWEGVNINDNETEETLAVTTDNIIEHPNKIYTSEINNPFYFPTLGITTAGTGTILAISTAAKALSQGQFGQFPLYAFTSEGVWALEVSSTGTFSARQPVTRDVCINPESVTQIDSAVLFATDRGIMLISGSDTVCLSDTINSRHLFALSDLPKAGQLVDVFNARAGQQEQVALENASLLPFRDFLSGCRMIYDYTGQRIIAYNPAVSYAYLYSLKSRQWGMMRSDIRSGINSYPEALAMVAGNKLADFSDSEADAITALLVTRPFKLGQTDALKTIDTVIQRGHFKRGHVAQVLYASRNLFDWHVVWSSTDHYLRGLRGTPYKYFRLALVCKLDKAESVHGCTVQFTPRLTNKPR